MSTRTKSLRRNTTLYEKSSHYSAKKAILEDEKEKAKHEALEKLWDARVTHERKFREKLFVIDAGHWGGKGAHKRSLESKSNKATEATELEANSAKVEEYIEEAEDNISNAIEEVIRKAVKKAGSDPTSGTILKYVRKVEKAIKSIIAENIKKTITYIVTIEGVAEPEEELVIECLARAISEIIKAADKIFAKTLEALGDNPSDEEVEHAIKKVLKLLEKIIDKEVRKALITIFELEEETAETTESTEHEKLDNRSKDGKHDKRSDPYDDTTVEKAVEKTVEKWATKYVEADEKEHKPLKRSVRFARLYN
ncbi:hypothetical protein AU210_000322 [Fusarium oxysporum f. sp. radicis-cucumerinum]|uniref:Uncharacterized protein n=1 Tax=Fusarium oxysporum f. sp. radicis-cucumerinum TaxID=327505 RepID=A0A2H3I6X1_FUSOX|nr:hypothetical protein AU210_000322 [Fusarium oxysporum f. sp. radicis-cucumerinum]